MTVIDVHTHMLDRGWLRLLKEKGAPRYDVGPISQDLDGIYHDGALFMTPMPGHFDYDLRIRDERKQPPLQSRYSAGIGRHP